MPRLQASEVQEGAQSAYTFFSTANCPYKHHEKLDRDVYKMYIYIYVCECVWYVCVCVSVSAATATLWRLREIHHLKQSVLTRIWNIAAGCIQRPRQCLFVVDMIYYYFPEKPLKKVHSAQKLSLERICYFIE